MTSRNLSLTALSCALATTGAGCANSVLGLSRDREASLDTRFVTQHSLLMTNRKLAQWLKPPAQLATAQAIPINQRRPESLPPQLSEAIAEHSATEHSAAEHSATEQEIRQRQFWDRGVEAGYAAAVSEQTAVTDTDWNRVISDWRAAIAPLEQISPQHPRYGDARTKIAIYQTGLKRAERQYIAVVQNRYAALGDPSGRNPSAKLQRLEQQPQMLAQQLQMLAQPSKVLAQKPQARHSFEADGQQLRTWIAAGNFSQVEQLLNQAVKSDRLTDNGLDYADAVLVSAVSQKDVLFTPQLLARLNQWVAQSPRSSMAYAVRSYFTQSYLWEDMALEIGKRSLKCPPTDDDLERLGISLADASIALSLDAKNPLALTSKLRLGKVGALAQNGQAQNGKHAVAVESVFQALIAVKPHSFQAHLEKASYLWSQDQSGSGQAALSFLRQAAAQAPADSALPMLVPMMHIQIANHRADYRQYLSQPQVWQEIQTGSERVVAQHPNAVPYWSMLADVATVTGRTELARRYQHIAINRAVTHPADQTWPKMMTSVYK